MTLFMLLFFSIRGGADDGGGLFGELLLADFFPRFIHIAMGTQGGNARELFEDGEEAGAEAEIALA